jgi:hypothetical protein
VGNRSAGLVGLEAVPHHRHARNHRPLAPGWFLCVLAADFQSPEAGRKKTDTEGGSGIDLSDGRSCGELKLKVQYGHEEKATMGLWQVEE